MSRILFFIQLIILIESLQLCFCANILYFSLTTARSHEIWDETLAKELTKNHNVTFVSHSSYKNMKNFTNIQFEGIYEKLQDSNFIAIWRKNSALDFVYHLQDLAHHVCEQDLETNGFKTLLNQVKNNVKYDLILFEMTFGQCLYPIIELFGSPPVIGTSPYAVLPYFTFPFGIDLNIAYNPVNTLSYTDQMSYFQRANNLFQMLALCIWRQYFFLSWYEQKLADKYFGSNFTSLAKIEKNFSLLIANTDPILDYPQSLPPAVIQVGGLHTQRVQTLTKELQNYLNRSKHGVILFTLGSIVRPELLDKEKIKAFVKAFSRLKQNVIWKLPFHVNNLPENILTSKWLPQNAILAHPNVKLFISHGGGLGTHEAMVNGVPILGFPFFADQHVNMEKIVFRKLGLRIQFDDVTAENLYEAIMEILSNPEYKQNALTISKRYKARNEDALTRAGKAVEYILEFGGEHLKIAPKDMSFVQIYMLDICVPLIIILLLILWTIYKTLYYLYKTIILFKNEKYKKD